MLISEQKFYDIINECVSEILTERGLYNIMESSYYENIIMDIMEEYDETSMLFNFIEDKQNGITRKQWHLIPAEQYKNLLERFMNARTIDAARIPENVVDSWYRILVYNAINIEYITEFAGHSQRFPSDALEDVFGEKYDVDWSDYGEASDFLENIGFYDWCKLPDGSDGWSDYGLQPIFNLLQTYNSTMEPHQTLLLINRVLDIGHHRGDLASAFIEGGSATCSQISGLHESAKWDMLDESIFHLLGKGYQWLRNKYNQFRGDFKAGRDSQRWQDKDYDPYAYYGNEADNYRAMAGPSYPQYRYDLTVQRNNAARDKFNAQQQTNNGPLINCPNPDLAKNKQPQPKTTKPKSSTKPKTQPTTRTKTKTTTKKPKAQPATTIAEQNNKKIK